jgi:serine/threonine protein kinase
MVLTVKYLHLQKICHRDLKAENFLFNRIDGDKITLIDFGLSYKWNHDMKKEL